jgi:hypothetical protein
VEDGQFLTLPIIFGPGGPGHEPQPQTRAGVSKLYAAPRTPGKEPW